MKSRLRYGLPLAGAVLALLWADHLLGMRHIFSALVAAASLLAWSEFARLALPTGVAWRGGGAAVVAAFCVLGWGAPLDGALALDGLRAASVPALVFLLLLVCALRWGAVKTLFADAACWLAGTLYLGYCTTYMLELRRIPDHGEALVLILIAAVKLGDTAAYFTGRALGRTKLCAVSPNKTIEGAIGGLIATTAVAVILVRGLLPAGVFSPLAAGVAAIAVGAAAQAGDLVESLIKRSLGTKHSGGIAPELGGVLDMIDSLVFAAPALYYLLRWHGI